ncbi:MAG: hypothetical protein WCP52_05245 [Bacteroidota bacterium]
MKVFVFFISLFFVTALLNAQSDSLPLHGTIKVSKHKDSTYITAFTNFFVYYKNPISQITYSEFVYQFQQKRMKASNGLLLKITDTKPTNDSASLFDYASYFINNHFTKDIRMRPQESDTVRLLVYVDTKGRAKFRDLVMIDKKGGSYIIYNKKRDAYKEDVSHQKTQKAFAELTEKKWQPAIISELKTHPSKRRNKYKVTKAYSEGLLTVIYASSISND